MRNYFSVLATYLELKRMKRDMERILRSILEADLRLYYFHLKRKKEEAKLHMVE